VKNPVVDKIYETFGEHFCVCPFLGGFYQTNNQVDSGNTKPNSVRPCSLIRCDDPSAWDITNNSLLDSRNTPRWKQLRQRFLDGEYWDIDECKTCTYTEKSGGTVPRQTANEFYTEFLNIDVIGEINNIINNDMMSNDLYTMYYYPSNYCNYACIMCSGGASSKRHTFEIKHLGAKHSIVVNDTDPDFHDALQKVQVLDVTGGETILQKQVLDLIDYLIDHDLAKNIHIAMLTNGSSYPTDVLEKLQKFKKVLYTISIDGLGSVIEYQRRGCNWETVEENCIRIINESNSDCNINYVATAVNLPSAMDFIDWCYEHQFKIFTITPVVRCDHLGASAMPPELRELALQRLYAGRERYKDVHLQGNFMENFSRGIEQLISTIENNPYREEHYQEFLAHIEKEDAASKRPLVECVPEWANYIP
jgi:MoaA/NifB/PqqE/SkfB family radical SAM enzyme